MKWKLSIVEGLLLLSIAGLLLSAAIPNYVEKRIQTQSNQQQALVIAADQALKRSMVDAGGAPSVQTLASYMQGDEVKALNNGLLVSMYGHAFTLNTYRDRACRMATVEKSDKVRCIGN